MQHSGDAPGATKIMPDTDTSVSLREVVRAEPSRPAVAPAEPAPLPEQKADVPAAAGAPDPHAAGAARYRRRVLLVLSAIALALGLYWASGYFFAYTDDAYVTSDLVSVAPYISGRILGVNIVDNQTVKKSRTTGDHRSDAFPASSKRKAGEKDRGRGAARGRSRRHCSNAGAA